MDNDGLISATMQVGDRTFGYAEETAEVANYDVNGDGYINRADAQLLRDHVTGGAALAANEAFADLNGDGQVISS